MMEISPTISEPQYCTLIIFVERSPLMGELAYVSQLHRSRQLPTLSASVSPTPAWKTNLCAVCLSRVYNTFFTGYTES
jgi:hypothetical protein